MQKKVLNAISPTRAEDYPEWYQQVIKAADMAEISDVKGCMVIKPWGYAIWENIQKYLDQMFKETGHSNAYFPLFIPKSYFEKEAKHVEGFAKECAVVTHSRLEDDGKDGLKIAGELHEPYIVRPTSETIIGASFSRWVKSYRDLPLLINQWANIVRMEMRTRLFLRTTEFLWQEGHTVHESEKEALEETLLMLKIYSKFAHEFLAIPVIEGEKTEGERFPGAKNTFCIEAIMQDNKALQAGTSHFLGQNFSKASEIKFQNKNGEIEYAWTTSWGISTRLIGAVIMAHSDDDGLILPPKIAPLHVVFIPIYKNEDDKKIVLDYINSINNILKKTKFCEDNLRIHIDDRDLNNGEKKWQWIKKGVPIRVEIGIRDINNNSVFIGRRDQNPNDKISLDKDVFTNSLPNLLDEIQKNIYNKALLHRENNTYKIDDLNDFYKIFSNNETNKDETNGAFVMSHWCENTECENKLKNDLKVSIRCIPLDSVDEDGTCIVCGKKSKRRILFAKSY
jgi:prolyl-tRNA synthetase